MYENFSFSQLRLICASQPINCDRLQLIASTHIALCRFHQVHAFNALHKVTPRVLRHGTAKAVRTLLDTMSTSAYYNNIII